METLSHPLDIGPLTRLMIRNSGRSWWAVKYDTGKQIGEWETQTGLIRLPTTNGRTSRWEEIPKVGIRGLYLICPNGEAGALESARDFGFFQLKTGGLGIGAGRYCDAHIIGQVIDGNGSCNCWAWEYREQRLINFTDNVVLAYRNIGAVSLGHHTGVK